MTRRVFANLAMIGKAVLTAGLLWWLAARVDTDSAFAAFGRFDAPMLLGALALASLQIILAGWRFVLIVFLCGQRIGQAFALRATLIGAFFSQLLVTFISGDAIRAWLLSRQGMSVGRAVEAVLLDRVIGVIALLLLVFAGFADFVAALPDAAMRHSAILLVAAVSAVAAGFLAFGRIDAVTRKIFRPWPWLGDLAAAGRHLFAGGRTAIAALVLALAIQALSVAIFYLLFRGLGLTLSWRECFAVVPMVMLITMIPISFAGWGLRESALIIALAGHGFAESDVLAASIAFGLAILAASLPGAVAWLRSDKHKPVPS
ncbi:MAG: YbhN family protein [Alphaproteobacteria bacterium]